jgi:hypothetical protein
MSDVVNGFTEVQLRELAEHGAAPTNSASPVSTP